MKIPAKAKYAIIEQMMQRLEIVGSGDLHIANEILHFIKIDSEFVVVHNGLIWGLVFGFWGVEN